MDSHDDEPGDEPGKLIGVVAAAAYLKVHRSTVYLAVRHNELLPDARTPHGHARFSYATLDAYRAHIDSTATGGRTTPSGARVSLRELFMARLVRLAAADADLEEIAREALRGVERLRPDLSTSFVCERIEDQSDPYALRSLAHQGVARSIAAHYSYMRSNGAFAVLSVMANGRAECCNDTTTLGMRPGTAVVMAQLRGLSFLVLPLIGTGETIGLMGFISTRKHAFSEEDIHHLNVIADLLATKLHDRQHRARMGELLRAAGELSQAALAGEPPADTQALRVRVRELADTYRRATRAYAVRSSGLRADIEGNDVFLEELAASAVAADPEGREAPPPVRVRRDGDQVTTGVRVAIPLQDRPPAALAAGWHEERADLTTDLAMLKVLAAACALAQARLPPREGDGSDSG